MKIYKPLSICLFSLIPLFALADIAPNPIQIKSIVPTHPVSIQMVSEIVKVQLSMDSSFVECTFYMHNTGKAQDLEIGFPVMNFYLWSLDVESKESDKDRFQVFVNGRQISKVKIYVPDQLTSIFDSLKSYKGYDLLHKYEDQNKPWYLWKSHFKKNESQVIIVKYALPSGATKMNRFFNYLLSTGAGWHGNIEHAKVIVNLNNIPKDQILSISPKNYKESSKTIIWDFRNLKPTKSDDILINYEQVKGSYAKARKKIDSIAFFIDGKKTKKHLSDFNPNDIAGININRKHPYEKYGAIFIYSKEYVLEKFKKKIKILDPNIWKQISNESVTSFSKNYTLLINKSINHGRIYEQMKEIDTIPILEVSIKKIDSVKKDMILTIK